MFAHPTRQGTYPRTAAPKAGTGLRRLATALAAVAIGLLASAAAIPAAFAMQVPDPGGRGGPARPLPVPASTVHVVTTGGMAGWQITLITLGAVLVAAAVTVRLARARAARGAAPSPAA